MRTDIVRTYKDIHSWVGIISGLALFIAFYAGAITMFEGPIQRWASPPPELSAPPSLENTPALIAKVLATHPEARKAYQVHLVTSPETPARVSWSTGNRRNPGITYFASLDSANALEVSTREPGQVAGFINILHQQVGLPFSHEIAMPIMGIIALLYAVAIISGIICLLPSLVKDLFALRFGKNLKRMWLDLHNVLGLFSLPFHIVISLTAVIFAFHDQFYDAQDAVESASAKVSASASANAVGESEKTTKADAKREAEAGPVLPPAEIAKQVKRQMPGFTLHSITYRDTPDKGVQVNIRGSDPRYQLRGATFGQGEVDPRTGIITESDYLPGVQAGWFATITSFFALHFGNYGGAPVRWTYFFLGLAGAFLFYSGNLLWIESRRKKERKSGPVLQTRATRILGGLTVGVPLGCVAGISATIAASKFLPESLGDFATWHSRIYYAIFVSAVIWAQMRGPARAGGELLWLAATATALIPLASLLSLSGFGWSHSSTGNLVDAVASLGVIGFALMARAARRRAANGPPDSIWSSGRGPLAV